MPCVSAGLCSTASSGGLRTPPPGSGFHQRTTERADSWPSSINSIRERGNLFLCNWTITDAFQPDTDQEHGEGEHPRDGKHVSRLACERHRRLKDLLVYALHCEELELAKEKMENKKLRLAQLPYQGNQGGQQRPQRGRGRGKGRGGRRQGPGQGQQQRPQSTQDFDVCNNCGLKGHWARGCRAPKNRTVSGNWDNAPSGDVTLRYPGGQPGFQEA